MERFRPSHDFGRTMESAAMVIGSLVVLLIVRSPIQLSTRFFCPVREIRDTDITEEIRDAFGKEGIS